MAFNFLIDAKFNDMRVVNGTLVLTLDTDTVEQVLYLKLNTQLGEWFLNTNTGLPYYSSTETLNTGTPGILGGNFSAAEIRSLFQREILSTDGVQSIASDDLFYDLSSGSRILRYTAEVVLNNDKLIILQVPSDEQ